MYRVQVIADSSGEWCGNGLKFDTIEEAKDYAINLMWRWTLVRNWRVLGNNDQPVMTMEEQAS